ncbi:cytochrome c oxidase subunit II [Opitutus sp. GAS368]|uniref:cytochrome c oxidase subunit II n=1 Tax=Opitutus sp. GAS368 TaxID=1882749 RepID=UPI00155FE8A1|nr:cytochrome c oxidase subunit II [Opitutus sp. GAS368]
MTRTRPVYRKVFRFAPAFLASLGLVLLTGCNKLHQVFSLSGPQSTMVTAGPVASRQWDLFMITVYVTTFIFIVVGTVLAYAQIKFRAKDDTADKSVPPPQGHGNPLIEVGLIAFSVLLLVIIAVPTVRDIWYTNDVPNEEKGNALDVTATGYQWWFQFRYDTEMVKLPAGGETPLVTGNELVVPAGRPVRVQVRTVDVIHSFWVPKLAGKVDMMPNRANFLWFKADHPGYYYGQCAEYCGESHAVMRFRVIALDRADYDKWLANQKQPARSVTAKSLAAAADRPRVQFASLKLDDGRALSGSPEFDANPLAAWHKQQDVEQDENPALVAQGRKLFSEKTCVSCHTVRGHEGIGITGPDLTRVGARSTIAAGVLENTKERVSQWLHDPVHFKPGNKMYFGGYMVQEGSGDNAKWKQNFTLNDTEINALVAYLHSLK